MNNQNNWSQGSRNNGVRYYQSQNQNWKGKDFQYNGNNRPQRKHSGCKLSPIKTGKNQGEFCLVAWNYSRSKGLVKLLIVPYSKTKQSTSKNGRVWENWMCKVVYTASGFEKIVSAMVDINGGNRAIISEMGWVANPKARNGGYCGTFTNKG